MKRLGRPTIRRMIAGLIGLALVLSVVGWVAAEGAADPTWLGIFTTPNQGFPEVALTIDGQPVTGQYLSSSLAAAQELAKENGLPFDRSAAIQSIIHRLVLKEAVAREIARRGYQVSDADVTAFLTQQAELYSAREPAKWASILQFNGDSGIQGYVANPVVRDTARRMLAGSKMFADMQAADPTLDPQAYVENLAKSVIVHMNFAP